MTHGLLGGGYPLREKNAAFDKPIEPLPPPPRVVLPMPLQGGVPCRPGVKAGDYVTVGQKIAEGLPAVHTPIAGRVSTVSPQVQPSGTSVLSVVVDNDFSGALCPAVRPPENPDRLTARQLLSLLESSGITEWNAPHLPIHKKIAAGMGRADTVIINACESEPYLAANNRLALEYPEQLLGGAGVLARLYGVDRVHIALEREKREAIQVLRAKIQELRAPAVVDALSLRYPQSAEKPLCRALTGRRTPPGASAAAIGCAVVDAPAAAALYEAVFHGRPLTHRIVTVAGSGIQAPRNLLCPVGVPIRFLLDACGGVDPKTFKILLGGPMTGHAQYDMDAPLDSSAAAVLAFCADEERSSAHPRCIRCGRCVSVCPVGLRPVVLYRYEQAGRLDRLRQAGLADCIECGACTYVCPGRAPLLQSFRTAKERLGKEEA
ncbi:MAG: RnfABCDGE type electron transport complex subunit C [Oscillospiraceae bacterium]|nr:RnfABCDGE type electron transport complex subunit C [Oscillospiraceae bacterium]